MEKKNNFYDSLMVKMGFLLHERFSVHILMLFVINMISAVIITGIFNAFKEPLVTYEILGFILFIVITTLVEALLKVFVLRHFISLLFRTWGILTALIQIMIFMLGDLIVAKFNFNTIWLVSILAFSFIFIVVRLAIVIIYQKYILKYLTRRN